MRYFIKLLVNIGAILFIFLAITSISRILGFSFAEIINENLSGAWAMLFVSLFGLLFVYVVAKPGIAKKRKTRKSIKKVMREIHPDQ